MPIIPKLECRVETFREDGAVFMRIGIHQEEMLLAYYAFDTLLTGFADKIALHDHENGADCEIVLAPAKLTTDAQISLTENDIECIKKLLLMLRKRSIRILEQTRNNDEFNHWCGSVLLVTSTASMRRLLNRLNLVSEPWQPSPKVKPQPLFSGNASRASSRWLLGTTKRSS